MKTTKIEKLIVCSFVAIFIVSAVIPVAAIVVIYKVLVHFGIL